jgi:hypothetical protein
MASKYIPSSCFLEWIILKRKLMLKISICWKEMAEVFSLIGNCLICSMGNGKHIRIREDPWVNSGEGFKLP